MPRCRCVWPPKGVGTCGPLAMPLLMAGITISPRTLIARRRTPVLEHSAEERPWTGPTRTQRLIWIGMTSPGVGGDKAELRIEDRDGQIVYSRAAIDNINDKIDALGIKVRS